MESKSLRGDSVLVIGAAGGIGAAVVAGFLADASVARLFAVSRRGDSATVADDRLQWLQCDHSDDAIASVVADLLARDVSLGYVVVATGTLHGEGFEPEKALDRIRRASLEKVLQVNTVIPSMWLAALTPLLRRSPGVVVAVLSARVGSIGDNALGGWYSYRASKAALNMILKSAAIELARRAPRAKLLAFHPGTTDTALSKPFQARVKAEKLFTPAFVAERLIELMTMASADGELDYLDWAGKPIPW